MLITGLRQALSAGLLLAVSLAVFLANASAQRSRASNPSPAIPTNILMRMVRAEDERRWDNTLPVLLTDKEASIRKRAALAMGRIGDDGALPALIEALKAESVNDVRQMIVFAIGEIESPAGASALIEILDDTTGPGEVRARAVEALGKIGPALSGPTAPSNQGTLPKAEDKQLTKIRLAILDALKFEAGRRSMPDRLTILLGLTATLRTKPDGAGPVIVRFLDYSDPRIVADALNTLARLRLKDGNDEARQLLKHADPIVRANAARVLGATEDKASFDALLDRALHDNDLRVRVSAIRALGSLKDERAAMPLLQRATPLTVSYSSQRSIEAGRARELNELLEIGNTLGRVLSNTNNQDALNWLWKIRVNEYFASPEFEIASARISSIQYVRLTPREIGILRGKPLDSSKKIKNWKTLSGVAQGLEEIARTKDIQNAAAREKAQELLAEWLNSLDMPIFSVPAVAQSYASFKPANLDRLLRKELEEDDVIVRSTAADLLGNLPPNGAIFQALSYALKRELSLIEKGEMNDAALAILDALAKQKSVAANDAIKTALDSSDHLIRRKAVALMKANGVGDFSNRIGTVRTRNTEADYRRAIARIGKHVTATVVTSKGAFTIEFLPDEAPLTVDNFVMLARKGYFNGQTIPRVVPNFVIQAGDPRGDTNGGPGYQIRCEINEVPYERGAVAMALSGKDTGGSQWFVTHSPQPHLDGGYTVFGRVIRGMEVVDNIARGDTIRSVTVSER